MKEKIIKELIKAYNEADDLKRFIEVKTKEAEELLSELNLEGSLNEISYAAKELQAALEYKSRLEAVRNNIEVFENLLETEDIPEDIKDLDSLTYELFQPYLTKNNISEDGTAVKRITQLSGFHKEIIQKLPVSTYEEVYGKKYILPTKARFKKQIDTAFILNEYDNEYMLICPEFRGFARYLCDITDIINEIGGK